MNNKTNSFLASKKHNIILIAILSFIIAIGGYTYYRYEENAIQLQKYNELSTIADLKVSQIKQWVNQRLADVNVVTKSPTFINSVSEWLQEPANTKLEEDIIERFQIVQEEFGYENIFLCKTNGTILLSVNTQLENFDNITKQKMVEAYRERKIVFTDFYYCETENKIHYDIIAPIFDDGKKIIALMLLRRDPDNYLYPLIQKWPTLSQSAETVILRVEQDSVLFLNEVRHKKNTALKLKYPLSRTDLIFVQAALGGNGFRDGIDYRGVEVLADVRIIPYTNWIMLTKIDKREIYSDLYISAGIIASFSFLIIVICFVGIAFFYNSRQRNIYKELYSKEKELWRQQEKFKVTIDGLSDGIIVTDPRGLISYLNKRAEELTGWNLREAKGRILSEVYSVKNEETGHTENNILEKVLRQGLVKELANHTILISKNGKEFPVTDSGAPIFDIDGTLHGIAISFQDETEKRKQQKLIKDSEYTLRSTLENMLEGCQIIGFDWKYLYINKAAEKHNRRPNAELLGKNYIEMWPGIEQTEIFKIIKKCMEERGPYSLENEFLFPDGSKGWFELSIEPIPEGILILSSDISERKEMELERQIITEELRRSNEKVQRIIADLNDVYWSASVNGLSIVEVSKSFERLYGYDAEQFKANPQLWIEVVHPDDKQIALTSGEELIKNGKAEAEYRIIRKDGSIRWILDRKSAIKDENGRVVQIGGIAKDITERKLAVEEIIKAKDKAEEINRLKSNFFANMSHELRTPFVGILGYAEILAESLHGTKDGEYAEEIFASSQRLTETLNEILLCSKLEFEKRKIRSSWFDCEKLIERVYKYYFKLAENKKLKFNKNVSFNNYSIYTDEELLEQVVSNLVNNAIKYTIRGSVIIFADIIKNNTVDVLRIEVKDTGIGIPKNKQDIIWEQFRQASEGLSRSFEGTGLGLTIVRENTKLLGGNISLKSEEGEGSTFILELPLIKTVYLNPDNTLRETTATSTSESEEVKSDKRKKILYVEDDKASRDVITRFLSDKYNIVTENIADKVIEIVSDNKFDAILMDINLGKGIDGIELSQLIKKVPAYKNIPIIAVTAFASSDDREEFLSKGISHYISKPFRQNELLELLSHVFEVKYN